MNAIPSRYNFLVTVGGANYAFSAATGKLAVVEDDSVWQFLKGCGCEGVSDSVIAGLLRDGFAVLPDTDEVVQLESRRFERQGGVPLTIVVMPTNACGIGCDECERPSAANDDNSMSLEAIDALVAYAKEARRDIHVNWIGGDPLLAFGVVEDLTQKLMLTARSNGCAYTASMVVAGERITDAMADALVDRLGIRSFTIAVDGPSEKRKAVPSPTGLTPLFEHAVNAAKILRHKGAEVTLSVSPRALSAEKLAALQRVLGDENIDVKLTFAAKPACRSNCAMRSAAGLPASFIGQRCALRRDCTVSDLLPQPFMNTCIYPSRFTFAVDWRGIVYKCLCDVVDGKNAVCFIAELPDRDSRFISMSDYPFHSKECKKCKALPICMGGCHDANRNGARLCIWNADMVEKLVSAYCSFGELICG